MQFREWMITIYRRFKGTPLEREIPTEVRAVMNNLFEGADDVVVGRPPMLSDMAASMDPAEVLRIREKAGLPGDLPFDDHRITTDGQILEPRPYVDRAARLDAEAEARAVLTLAQEAGEEVPNRALDVAAKWRASEKKNRLRMEKDLLTLESEGYEVRDALDLLDEYDAMERVDFDDAFEFAEARQQAWDDLLDALEEVEPLEVIEEAAELPAAAVPAVAGGPALEAPERIEQLIDELDRLPVGDPRRAEITAEIRQLNLDVQAGRRGVRAEPAAVGGAPVESAQQLAPAAPEDSIVPLSPGPPGGHGPPQEVPSGEMPVEAGPSIPVVPEVAPSQPMATPAQLRPEGIQSTPETQAAQQQLNEAERAFYRDNPTASLAALEAEGKLPAEIAAARQQVNELIMNAPARLGDDAVPGQGAPATIGTTPSTAIYNADEEMVWQAFKSSLRTEAKVSFRTHYFNTQRSWFERSLNHPYLGLYPASYMWGKVLPEFARFLLMRPFGVRAPLVGLESVERLQQRVETAMAEDDSFAKYLSEHPDLIYAFEMMVPALPTNMPANFPAYARHISQDLQAGRKVDLETVAREMSDSAGYAFGGMRTLSVTANALNDVLGMGGDLYTELAKGAAIYDGQAQELTGAPLPGSTLRTQPGLTPPTKGAAAPARERR